MELSNAFVLAIVLLAVAGLWYLSWQNSNKKKERCPICGETYEGTHCPRCNRYCLKCHAWYTGDFCPICIKYCKKCEKTYTGDVCLVCGKRSIENKKGYKTENEEYAAEHHLWICSYCETLNEDIVSAESSALHGRGVIKSGTNSCICCGKSGAKNLEKRSIEYVL